MIFSFFDCEKMKTETRPKKVRFKRDLNRHYSLPSYSMFMVWRLGGFFKLHADCG